MHGGIVVAGRDAFDIEAAVIRLARSFAVEDHAGGDGALALGVADVETLHALGPLGEIQRIAQRVQATRVAGLAAEPGLERDLGIAAGHLQPARTLGAHPSFDLHPALGAFRERRLQERRSSGSTLTTSSGGICFSA